MLEKLPGMRTMKRDAKGTHQRQGDNCKGHYQLLLALPTSAIVGPLTL
jgi:hypothetical protein